MDRPTLNNTQVYSLEADGKFYVAYQGLQAPSRSGAHEYCWKENATAGVPYPKLAQTIMAKYANLYGMYVAGAYRINGTKWATFDGMYSGTQKFLPTTQVSIGLLEKKSTSIDHT
jgi:hypothetical protein